MADALIKVSKRSEEPRIAVTLDFDENSMRLGYGHIDAVKILKDAHISIELSKGLRIGLVDDTGFMSTPIALLLEKETENSFPDNAMKLSREQTYMVMEDFSKKSQEIILSHINDGHELSQISKISLEVPNTEVDKNSFEQVESNLKISLPIPFDVANKLEFITLTYSM